MDTEIRWVILHTKIAYFTYIGIVCIVLDSVSIDHQILIFLDLLLLVHMQVETSGVSSKRI